MFTSAHNALEWAYNTSSRPIIKMAAINNMRQGSSGGIPNDLLINLTTQDKHGQAALIIGLVESMPRVTEREFLEARFGRKVGYSELATVTDYCRMALGLEPGKSQAVYRVVKGYFCVALQVREIRSLLGCRTQHAIMSRRCLYDTLDVIHRRAMADISEVLERQGLIER